MTEAIEATYRKLGQRTRWDVSDIVIRWDGEYLHLAELPTPLQTPNSTAVWEVNGTVYLSNSIQTGPRVRVRLVKPA